MHCNLFKSKIGGTWSCYYRDKEVITWFYSQEKYTLNLYKFLFLKGFDLRIGLDKFCYISLKNKEDVDVFLIGLNKSFQEEYTYYDEEGMNKFFEGIKNEI